MVIQTNPRETFLQRIGTSLLFGNGEVLEATHQQFDECWRRYQVTKQDPGVRAKNSPPATSI